MWLNILLSVLLLIIAVSFVFTTNKFRMIAYFAAFSFTSACLYFVNQAPDISLAEIAVGCAFIPLIFTIAISRQNTFIVLFFHQINEQAYCEPEMLVEFMAVAESFCEKNGLKLKILTKPVGFAPDLRDIFRPGNIDIIADYQFQTGILKLVGNRRNSFIAKFEHHFKGHKRVRFSDTEVGRYED